MSTNQVIQTSEIWLSASKSDHPIVPQYPDFRFSCIKCGSLDVFIKNSKKNSTMNCLDCKNVEMIA